MNIMSGARTLRALEPLQRKFRTTKAGVWYGYLAGPLSKAIKDVPSFMLTGFMPIMTALFAECAVRTCKGTGENVCVWVYAHHQCVQDAVAKNIDAIHEPARVALRSFLLSMYSVIVMVDIPNLGLGRCAYHIIDAVWKRELLHASVLSLPSCALAQQVSSPPTSPSVPRPPHMYIPTLPPTCSLLVLPRQHLDASRAANKEGSIEHMLMLLNAPELHDGKTAISLLFQSHLKYTPAQAGVCVYLLCVRLPLPGETSSLDLGFDHLVAVHLEALDSPLSIAQHVKESNQRLLLLCYNWTGKRPPFRP